MTSIFTNPWALSALYAGNALWHTSALVHFGFRQPFMMRKLALRRQSADPAVAALPEGDPWHHDVMAYLGGMNSALALLAAVRLAAVLRLPGLRRLSSTTTTTTGGGGGADPPIDATALLVLGMANCSQMFLNFARSRPSRRWICGWHLDRITVLDTAFTVLDWAAAAAMLAVLP